MKKKLNSKHESGITLIALIITIIVLLILAGVAIVTLTGDNGILGKASNAKIETEKGRLKETTSLAVSELVTEKLSTGGKTSDITAQNIVDKVKEKVKELLLKKEKVQQNLEICHVILYLTKV